VRSIGATSGYFQEPPGKPWKICRKSADDTAIFYTCQKHPKNLSGFPVDFPLPSMDRWTLKPPMGSHGEIVARWGRMEMEYWIALGELR